MCVNLYIDGECMESIGDVRARMPVIVMDEGIRDFADTWCLCCMNIGATAKANGYVAEREWPETGSRCPGDYVARKVNP